MEEVLGRNPSDCFPIRLHTLRLVVYLKLAKAYDEDLDAVLKLPTE